MRTVKGKKANKKDMKCDARDRPTTMAFPRCFVCSTNTNVYSRHDVTETEADFLPGLFVVKSIDRPG
jgi:hypothetical protein